MRRRRVTAARADRDLCASSRCDVSWLLSLAILLSARANSAARLVVLWLADSFCLDVAVCAAFAARRCEASSLVSHARQAAVRAAFKAFRCVV